MRINVQIETWRLLVMLVLTNSQTCQTIDLGGPDSDKPHVVIY